MPVQLSEQPNLSLPPVIELTASKAVEESEASPGSEISAAIDVPSVHIPGRYVGRVSQFLGRSDELGHYVKQLIAYLVAKIREFFQREQRFVYTEAPLSFESQNQLNQVSRKTLVLDLDETLVHSCYVDPDTRAIIGCNLVPETAAPDYVMHIPILAAVPPIQFQVYKRPFVDEFLNLVARWYDVVIYTASLEAYASMVIDKLDAGRGILQRRFYRQHCVATMAFISKNLYVVTRDLANVCIIDNSPSAYRDFPENAIPISSYVYDPTDQELLNLLPFLDALRFTRDVRSILGRRITRNT